MFSSFCTDNATSNVRRLGKKVLIGRDGFKMICTLTFLQGLVVFQYGEWKKREDPGDEVGLPSYSLLSSSCLTDTGSSHVSVVVA